MDNTNQNASLAINPSATVVMPGSQPVIPPVATSQTFAPLPVTPPAATPQTFAPASVGQQVASTTAPMPASTQLTTTLVAKKKILVVDDEPDAKDLFAELLRTNLDYQIETAMDGHECLAKCAQYKFDLVLLDIVMPNLDGVDTLSQIKMDPAKYGTPIVIMLTNIGGDIAIQESLKLGAVGYKLKIDTEPNELLDTVAKAFAASPINA